jgi:hypothetical protein
MQLINEIVVNKHQLTVKINDNFKKYFVEDFWLKCDTLDLEVIPKQILIIPFILNVAPVIWANNLTVQLPYIDAHLERSLSAIKAELAKIYPDTTWGGSISSAATVDSKPKILDQSAICLLFSGGVDSVSASQELINCKQLLVTLRGADIKLDDNIGWQEVKQSVTNYAKEINATTFFIESNFTVFLNHLVLEKRVKHIPNWWGNVQHAIGLAGFMTLPAWQFGIGKVAMASDLSVSQMQGMQWASVSSLIESLRWSDCQLVHASNLHTRQDKINQFVKKYKDTGILTQVRVCYESRGGKNCGKCRKCTLTMLNLLVAGVDYEEFGFSLPKGVFAHKIQHTFFKIDYEIPQVSLALWKDMIVHIKARSFYEKAGFSIELLGLMNWLRSFDIESHAGKTVAYAQKRREIIAFAKQIPFLYATYRMIKRLKNPKYA